MKPITSVATCKASPETAFNRILSEEGLHAWWIGKVKVVEKDPSWPALNSKMIFKAGGGIFASQVVESLPPTTLVMMVKTPAAESVVTHSFVSIPGGGTRYSKTVNPLPRSKMGSLFMLLFGFILKSLVKKEVKRAAEYADKG